MSRGIVHSVWIDNGSDADYDKLRRHGITSPYFDPRDPRVTSAYLDKLVVDGFQPGLYFAWDWYVGLDGTGFATKVDAELKRIAWKGNAPVCVDIETHDMRYIRDFFAHWRTIRPTRKTDLTLEGLQGGLLDPRTVYRLIVANVGIAPSFYAGDMSPLPHSVLMDLLLAGIPADRIIGMYDAAKLPSRWSGYAFTQGRLP